VANSGVITALDGAASQYVRGDGTLADFPTSTGGGSSVSYYLNSSVSQGTIGGVAYRQLSKTPISGAGTDITASTNGYIASYITDANDPSLLEVPAGNFNCEFYFSVNSNNHNPYVYAELYKYNGTTFTLLGTSQSIPEYLSNGTTLSAYYFAIPVAVAALTITDRLAIRIYANVDGRVVTLHTENNHLCQVVTTFSKGLTTLNNLTRQVQFLATGTSGTDFGIVSSVATHTFNLPIASATNTGKLSSTDWSTFNGKVPYTGATANVDLGTRDLSSRFIFLNGQGTIGGNLFLRKDVDPVFTLNYTTLYSTDNNFGIGSTDGTNTKKAIFSFGSLTNNTLRTYTLPDASGTLALTSDISYPITSVFGRTGAVVAASGDYTTTQVTEGTNLYFTNARARGALSFAAGSGAYNSTTGVITIPTNNNQITNGAGYITSSALSDYLPLTGGTLTGPLNGTTATFSGLGTFNQLTMTGATAGRLFYAQTGGVFSQSGNLVWNNTNEMLGVGTPNPSAVVTAFSTNAATQLKAAGTAPAITFSNTLTSASLACVFGLATSNNHFITGTAAGDMAIANQSTSAGAIVFGTGTFEKMRMTAAGTFSIGNTNSTYNLDVTGTGRFTSTLLLGGALSGTSATFSTQLKVANPTGSALDMLVLETGFNNPSGNKSIIWKDASNTLGRISVDYDASYGSRMTFGSLYNGGYQTSNLMTITGSGNVGIGTSAPVSFTNYNTLSVNGTTGGAVVTMSNGTSALRMACGTTDSALWEPRNVDFAIGTNNTERMRILANGITLIYSVYSQTSGAAANVIVGSDGNLFRSTSSLKYKKNVNDYTKGLAEVMQLRPVTYNGINELDGDKQFAGLIAEEVHELGLTEFVQYAEDGTPDALAYQNMIALLVKGMQELNQKGQEQQAQIEELKELIKNK
jgi:hypothetical protein